MPTDAFLSALIAHLAKSPRAATPDPELTSAAARAPEPASALLHAVAAIEVVHVMLGWREIWQPGVGLFASSLDLIGIAPGDPRWFDATNSVELGASGGGEVHFGVRWEGASSEWVEIDPDNQSVTRFADTGAFFRHVLSAEREQRADVRPGRPVPPMPPHLEAIFAAAGEPIAI